MVFYSSLDAIIYCYQYTDLLIGETRKKSWRKVVEKDRWLAAWCSG